MNRRRAFAVGLSAVALLTSLVACKKAKRAPEEPPPGAPGAPPAAAEPVEPVPPAAFQAEPVSAFVDAGPIQGSPFEQASAYQENGQHWLARLLIENRALGAEGTRAEIELLASICDAQGDQACLDQCGVRLGKKLTVDAAAPEPVALPLEHTEPETELSRARDHALKGRHDEARAILEPKVLDGKASREEIRLLLTTCKEQGDRMCAALCESKLR